MTKTSNDWLQIMCPVSQNGGLPKTTKAIERNISDCTSQQTENKTDVIL